MASQWSKFSRQFRGDPRLSKTDIIYAIPLRLLACIRKHARRVLSADDLRFESQLRRSGGTGFWNGDCFVSRVLDTQHSASKGLDDDSKEIDDAAIDENEQRSPDHRLSEFFKHMSVDRISNDVQNQKRAKIADQIRARAKGFAGWVATSETFGVELSEFVAKFGKITTTTPIVPPFLDPPPERDLKDLLETQSKHLLSRWTLDRITTPHLVEPLDPTLTNLGGATTPESNETGVTLHIPWPYLVTPQLPIQEVINLQSSLFNTSHLGEWLRGDGGFGWKRYGQMLDLLIYLHLALLKRYPERIQGNQENLDRAFDAFWNPGPPTSLQIRSTDGVRKLRRILSRRLRRYQEAVIASVGKNREMQSDEIQATFDGAIHKLDRAFGID